MSLVEHVELLALKANCPNKALKILDVQLYLVQVCQCNQVSFNTVNEVGKLVDSASQCIPHLMVSVVDGHLTGLNKKQIFVSVGGVDVNKMTLFGTTNSKLDLSP